MFPISINVRRIPYITILLVCVFVFQISVIPDTLGIKPVGRIVNVSVLASFVALLLYNKIGKLPISIYTSYLIPIFLIVLGNSINILVHLSPENISQVNTLLPWLAALSIPFCTRFDLVECWRIYYLLLLYATITTLVEYALVLGGLLSPTIIETERGIFMKGIISIFHGLEDGVVYYRYYGIFPEPGTAAMFLLIGLAFSLMYSKKAGTVIFLAALYFTDSLGGQFSAVLMVATFCYVRFKNTNLGYFIVLIALAATIQIFASGFFQERYAEKDRSATVRESNVTMFAENMVDSLIANPFGFDLQGKSQSELQSKDNYYGANFTVYSALVQGGYLGLLGYMLFLVGVIKGVIKWWVLPGRDRSDLMTCAFISLPPLIIFIFQRATIFETALFAFLYAVPVMNAISPRSIGAFDMGKVTGRVRKVLE